MISSLYEPFKKWSQTGSVYIISDTHFDDEDCKLMDKNWMSPEEHIRLLKKLIHKTDTLVHLGDVGNTKWISQLNCYKVLIMGNHDAGAEKFRRIKAVKRDSVLGQFDKPYNNPHIIEKCDNHLFDEIYSGPLMISEKILLSHEPILGLPFVLNIHGHDHSGTFIDNKHINVASNVCNYTPFNLGKYIKEHGLSNIKSIHRITIDGATERKNKRSRGK